MIKQLGQKYPRGLRPVILRPKAIANEKNYI